MAAELNDYLHRLIHQWSRTLALLGIVLVPIFYVLDLVVAPREVLFAFGVYRGITVLLLLGHYFYLRFAKPGRWPHVHGYAVSLVTGGMIALLTTQSGGFHSSYWVGIALPMIAVAILLPWGAVHAAIDSLFLIVLYVSLNLIFPQGGPIEGVRVFHNLFFLVSFGVIVVAISFVKQQAIEEEFRARSSLSAARDALWSEMEVAKKIQSSLLPTVHHVRGYHVAGRMIPASEMSGDYYDIIETPAGEIWLAVGDVSGHGVESGLIMMMTQTSILCTVSREPGVTPARVLAEINAVIRQNMARLETDRYMTLTLARLDGDHITFFGRHQDILIHRQRTGTTDAIPTLGSWIGVTDDVRQAKADATLAVGVGDTLLFFTDGLTEAVNAEGEMFGQTRLQHALDREAHLDAKEIVDNILHEVQAYMTEQTDDMALLVLKRVE